MGGTAGSKKSSTLAKKKLALAPSVSTTKRVGLSVNPQFFSIAKTGAAAGPVSP